MATDFSIIDFLSGLTRFTFDKRHLMVVALKCGVSEITDMTEITEEQMEKCEIELLKLVVYGPYTTSSVKNKHGNAEVQVGSYTLTSTQLESVKARLRRLMEKWDMDEEVEELDDAGGQLMWIDENKMDL